MPPKKTLQNTPSVGATADSLVPVTYELTVTDDIIFKALFIGDTEIKLVVDRDPANPNKFATRGSKKYMCILEPAGLRVFALADGKAGGHWSLTITSAGSPLNDNPIDASTDGGGHLNHDAFHN